MKTSTKTVRNIEQASILFQEHGDTIRSTISSHINDKSSIDDIFQDFFLELVKNPVPSKVNNVKYYLSRAVKNDVLDASLREKSYHLRNQRYAQMNCDRFKSQTPDELAAHSDEIRHLFEIVKTQLLDYESEAVIQKYQHGRNTSQAAKVMGIRKRSFSHYLCTGMKKIKLFLQEIQSPQDNCKTESK